MEYISSLAACLQSSTFAVVEAYESVSTVIETLEAVRTSLIDTMTSGMKMLLSWLILLV